jgi:uncharacterized membrane protein YcaP (DUF421 family)
MRRRLIPPLRRALALLALLALPACAALGLLDRRALGTAGRVALIFLVLMLAFRMLGKRELSRLSPFELVTLMLIPEVLSDALQQEGALMNGLVALSALLAMVFSTSLLAHRFPAFSRVVEAQPAVLVHDGQLCERTMNAERIQPEELISEMRRHGFEHLSQIKWALLEGGGNVSFIARDPKGLGPNPSAAASDSE